MKLSEWPSQIADINLTKISGQTNLNELVNATNSAKNWYNPNKITPNIFWWLKKKANSLGATC